MPPLVIVGATSVTDGDGVDADDVPTLFVAVTLNVYEPRFVSPVTVQVNGPLVHAHVCPPVLAVTV